MLFAGESYSSFYYSRFESSAGVGLLLIILGPIAIRISYEFIMMAILAVNNIISINRKLKNQNNDNVPNDVPQAFSPADYMAPKLLLLLQKIGFTAYIAVIATIRVRAVAPLVATPITD